MPTVATVSVCERGCRKKIQREPDRGKEYQGLAWLKPELAHWQTPLRRLRVIWLVHWTVKGAVTVLLCPADEQLTVYVPVPAPVFETVR